jgi:hypothetical protein
MSILLTKLFLMKTTMLAAVKGLALAAAVMALSCNSADKKAGGAGGNDQAFRFNPPVGAAYDITMQMDMDQKVMGQNNKIGMSTTYNMHVKGLDTGVYDLHMKYNHFRMSMNAGGMDMEIDSDKPATETPNTGDPTAMMIAMMNRVFSGIKGQSFSMKLSESGEISDIKGLQNIVQAMVDSMGLPPEAQAQVGASLNDQFNENDIRNSFQTAYSIYPNKPIKVGESWTRTASVKGKMPMMIDSKYTVKAIENGIATLGVASTFSPLEKDGNNNIKGTQDGEMQVDLATGITTEARLNQQFTMESQGVPVEMKSLVTIKSKQVQSAK